MKDRFGLVCLLLLVWLIMPCQMVDSGVDESDSSSLREPPRGSKSLDSDGLFYAEISQIHDLHNPNFFEANVKVFPLDSGNYGWPDQSLMEKNFETNQRYWIKIRGIDCPSINEPRNKPHAEMRRVRRRFSDAMDFVWNILSASEYMVLTNPKLGGEFYLCDVYVDLGGQRLSLASMMEDKGHAMFGVFGEFDWGKEVVRRRKPSP